MSNKFVVIKNDDVFEYLNNYDRKMLVQILDKIQKGRSIDGKNTGNSYLIINTDEKYAPKVAEIMKSNGHWN